MFQYFIWQQNDQRIIVDVVDVGCCPLLSQIEFMPWNGQTDRRTDTVTHEPDPLQSFLRSFKGRCHGNQFKKSWLPHIFQLNECFRYVCRCRKRGWRVKLGRVRSVNWGHWVSMRPTFSGRMVTWFECSSLMMTRRLRRTSRKESSTCFNFDSTTNSIPRSHTNQSLYRRPGH